MMTCKWTSNKIRMCYSASWRSFWTWLRLAVSLLDHQHCEWNPNKSHFYPIIKGTPLSSNLNLISCLFVLNTQKSVKSAKNTWNSSAKNILRPLQVKPSSSVFITSSDNKFRSAHQLMILSFLRPLARHKLERISYLYTF